MDAGSRPQWLRTTLAVIAVCVFGCGAKSHPAVADPGWELTTPEEDRGVLTLDSIDFSEPVVRLPPGTLDWAPPGKTVVLHTRAGRIPGRVQVRDPEILITHDPAPSEDSELTSALDSVRGRLVFVGIDGDLHDDELHLYQCIMGRWEFADYSVECGMPHQFKYWVRWRASAEAQEQEPQVPGQFLRFFRRARAEDDHVSSYIWMPDADLTMIREVETWVMETEYSEWPWKISIYNSIHSQL